MAVTLDAAALAAAVGRAADDPTVARMRPVVVDAVEGYASAAPEATANEAAIRTLGYMLTANASAAEFQIGALRIKPVEVGNVLRRSGAAALLAPWRQRRALRSEAATS